MLFLTSNTILSVNLACYMVSCAKGLVSGDCATCTNSFITEYIVRFQHHYTVRYMLSSQLIADILESLESFRVMHFEIVPLSTDTHLLARDTP